MIKTLKIVNLAINHRPILVDEIKPDRRYSCGYRRTGRVLPKISTTIELSLEYHPKFRTSQAVCVPKIFGTNFMIVFIDAQKKLMQLKSLNAILVNDSISHKDIGESVDVVPFGFMYREGSSHD